MILVTGSTGTVGRELLAELRDRNVGAAALVHSRDKAEVVGRLGAEARIGDFDDHDTLRAAVRNIDRLFLLTPATPRQVAWETDLLAIASEAGIERIVRLSVINADPRAPEFIYSSHGRCEQALAESGIAHTILRCNDFMQNFLLSAETISSKGRVYGTGVGRAAVGMVDVRDIAAVAAETLSEDGHEGRRLVVTGPEAISFPAAAQILSSVLRTSVAYEELPGNDYVAALVGVGLPEWRAESLRELYESYGGGTAAVVTGAVRETTGARPRALKHFARDHTDQLLAR
ncbi:MAG: NmrA family NAD(P)-binding protein [Solirubrobacterales bacterium]